MEKKTLYNNKIINKGHLHYRRTPIEKESPEEYGYEKIKYNLSESSVPDAILSDLDIDLKDLALSYIDHLGNPRLRQAIANEGEGIKPKDVLITTGAAGALFIITTSLLKPTDHVILLHPNYVANVETPRAIGCQIDYLRLSFEENFRLDVDMIEQMIKPNTRLVSLTYPHNPTGTTLQESELNKIIAIIESKGCFLLLDETYRDLSNNPPPIAASLSSNAISVSSFSKAYGLPGIRAGWLINQDSELVDRFLAAKELIFICNSIIDEEIAAHFFINKKNLFLKEIQTHLSTNKTILKTWMNINSQLLEWIEPQGGCISFPRIKSNTVNLDKFYNNLKEVYKTFVAPGRWFEVDNRFMRIGYGYPSKNDLIGGLDCIINALETAL